MRGLALIGSTLSLTIGLAACQTPRGAAPNGADLYAVKCLSCHTTEASWRDGRAASDWAKLSFQVRRWQQNIGAGWDDDEITAVARYLNDRYYHFAEAGTTK